MAALLSRNTEATLAAAVGAFVGAVMAARHSRQYKDSVAVATLSVVGAGMAHGVLSGLGTHMFGTVGLVVTCSGAYFGIVGI